MGWKIYLIVITNAASINTNDVAKKLGFDTLKPTKEISIHEAQYESGISIGKYGDKIFIVSSDLVFKFYNNQPSEFEKRISEEFPNSEIAAITIYETSNLYGYNIIDNGKRRRVKSGADLETYVDYGDKLPEEDEVSKGRLFDDDELKEMKEDYSDTELKKVIDQEISVRATFLLTKRYLGKQFDDNESDYEKIRVTKFE